MDSTRGRVLVAVPQLPDANFFRTVVMMVQHDAQGAMGLVLNRPSAISVAQLWSELTEERIECDHPLMMGGPVEGPLMAVHTRSELAEAEIFEGVYVCSQKTKLEQVVREGVQPFRLYSGYSGWAPGQLENELQQGGWFTAPIRYDYVFGEVDELWKRVADDIGRRIVLPELPPDQLPPDPSLN